MICVIPCNPQNFKSTTYLKCSKLNFNNLNLLPNSWVSALLLHGFNLFQIERNESVRAVLPIVSVLVKKSSSKDFNCFQFWFWQGDEVNLLTTLSCYTSACNHGNSMCGHLTNVSWIIISYIITFSPVVHLFSNFIIWRWQYLFF